VVGEVQRGHPAYAGQAAYSRGGLRLYDVLVYRFSGPVIWGCPKSRLVELYDECISSRHLDIGVATGRLLDECRFPTAAPEITLMDLNPSSLEVAARRLARYAPHTHNANVLEPWELPPASYDSVAMANLLHCLPGALPEKAVAFEHARTALAPGGVLFGATVLGEGIPLTRRSRMGLAATNRRGVFSNLKDSLHDLDAALARVFDWHDIQVQGAVALFRARASS
jgi:SAM-dependent methyltransferase